MYISRRVNLVESKNETYSRRKIVRNERMKNIINYRYTELILFFSLPFYLFFFFFFLPKRSNSSDIKTHTAILQANVILAIKTALKNNLAIHRSLLYHVLYDIIELEYHRQENHGKKKKKKKKNRICEFNV